MSGCRARLAKKALLAAVALHCALALPCPSRAAEVPYLTGRVVDDAGVLGTQVRERLEAHLAEHERRTGNQLAVLTVPSLAGETIEGFAEKVFRTWALGQQEKDNGVLVVIAT